LIVLAPNDFVPFRGASARVNHGDRRQGCVEIAVQVRDAAV
jgi:hypothetical protein